MKSLFCMIPLVLLAVACGSNQPEAESAPVQVDAVHEQAAAVSEKEPLNWAAKPLLEKQIYMKETVVPAMGELFLDGHPDFSCATCHGKDLVDVNFKMPNTLHPFDPANMPFQSADEKVRYAAEFMKTQVVPKMAGLLEMPTYNPETRSGFGCFNCHAVKPAM